MIRAYYSNSIHNFITSSADQILATLVKNNEFPLEQSQKDAWVEEIKILKNSLKNKTGKIYFEYSIPRMGKRIDSLLLINSIVFVLEFKIGEKLFPQNAIDQVWDYALDLKNFHEQSHNAVIAPILISSRSTNVFTEISMTKSVDQVFNPIKCNPEQLSEIVDNVILCSDSTLLNYEKWEESRYHPTPTIIEAAMALYNGHDVKEISRSDANAKNLSETSNAISEIIDYSKSENKKSICFVTGVPGAGKTLVGLQVATQHIDKDNDLYSVFLSGNGPLVAILREALARDKVRQEKLLGKRITLAETRRSVKMFIQNVHNFRDEGLIDIKNPPLEHIVLFDEAQRAWTIEQASNFMKRKKHISNFNQSEPEFLISCMDRFTDWAVIVCLVGGGQEINTGEAGISEWIDSINRTFNNWDVFISSRLTDSAYGAGKILEKINKKIRVQYKDDLHLSVSMRSFRSEKVSLLIKVLLDLQINQAKQTLIEINEKYPIVITRDLTKAKQWLKSQARGSERYGIVVSSQALRLKPFAIDVKSTVDPIHWFLDPKEDVRSSYYLEDVATEFDIQGLELDWACVMWDGDFRLTNDNWEYYSFCGDRWNSIRKPERKMYLKNAYRVLLTRARQGMVIVVPEGNPEDPTRKSEYYDPVFTYLSNIGFKVI